MPSTKPPEGNAPPPPPSLDYESEPLPSENVNHDSVRVSLKRRGTRSHIISMMGMTLPESFMPTVSPNSSHRDSNVESIDTDDFSDAKRLSIDSGSSDDSESSDDPPSSTDQTPPQTPPRVIRVPTVSSTPNTPVTYEIASKRMSLLCLNSAEQFAEWSRDNHNERVSNRIPARPDKAYSGKGWKGWETFLGGKGLPKGRPKGERKPLTRVVPPDNDGDDDEAMLTHQPPVEEDVAPPLAPPLLDLRDALSPLVEETRVPPPEQEYMSEEEREEREERGGMRRVEGSPVQGAQGPELPSPLAVGDITVVTEDSVEENSYVLHAPPSELLREGAAGPSCKSCKRVFRRMSEDIRRVPRMLRCLHSRCTECIDGMADAGACDCPDCGKRTPLGSDGARALLCSFADLADVNRIQSNCPKTCELCEEGKVTHRCKQCEEFMCSACVRIHTRQKMSRDHEVQTIEEFTTSPEVRRTPVVYCPVHMAPKEMHELTLYCVMCDNKPICMACTMNAHKGHGFGFISEMGKVVVAPVRRLHTEVVQRRPAVQAVLDKVLIMSEKIIQAEKDATAKVEKVFDKLVAEVETRREKALMAIDAESTKAIATLQGQQNELEFLAEAMDSSCEKVDQTLLRCSDAEVLLSKPVMMQWLTELAKQDVDPEPREHRLLEVNAETDALYEHLAKLGGTRWQ